MNGLICDACTKGKHRYVPSRVVQAIAVIRRHSEACAFVTGLSTHDKQHIRACHIGTLTLVQILARARAFMKDETSADESVVAAAQPAYKNRESYRTENRIGKITCFRCDVQNHLARD